MKIIIGNLLDIKSGTILHQVNCRGVVGGLAGALYARWPAAFTPYFEQCRRNEAFALGAFVLGEAEPGLRIGHVFGQLNPGANTDMAAVNESFGYAMMAVDGPIFAPWKMGCGLGGGNWADYIEHLEACFPALTIVQRPEDAQ